MFKSLIVGSLYRLIVDSFNCKIEAGSQTTIVNRHGKLCSVEHDCSGYAIGIAYLMMLRREGRGF